MARGKLGIFLIKLIILLFNLIMGWLKKALEWLKPYSNLIVGIATIVIAIATVKLVSTTKAHINEAARMRIETKRLADLSTEQFKIKSYPTFIVETPNITTEKSKIHQETEIKNVGEITAHKLKVLFVLVYQEPNNTQFECLDNVYYCDGAEKIRTLDYERIIPSKALINVENDHHFSDNYPISKLKNLLVFLRFWVPYDTKLRYEYFGYSLKKVNNANSSYVWQEMIQKDTSNKVGLLIKTVFPDGEKRIQSFFVDFDVNELPYREN